MKVIHADPSPYQQIRTAVDLHAYHLVLTFRVRVIEMKKHKCMGAYLGEVPQDNTKLNGFKVLLTSTIPPGNWNVYRITGVKLE
ncbi:hypothetical protein GF312_19375 [Candidatus Poribacteria bacterium]|nr:hypothetical protein [Candidatus Poribacteria bacterium]